MNSVHNDKSTKKVALNFTVTKFQYRNPAEQFTTREDGRQQRNSKFATAATEKNRLKESVRQRGLRCLTHPRLTEGMPASTARRAPIIRRAPLRTYAHAKFAYCESSRGPRSRKYAGNLSSLPIVPRQCRIRTHEVTFLAEGATAFFRRSTPRRPSASTTVAPDFHDASETITRSDTSGRCNWTVDRSALHRHTQVH